MMVYILFKFNSLFVVFQDVVAFFAATACEFASGGFALIHVASPDFPDAKSVSAKERRSRNEMGVSINGGGKLLL